MTSTNLLYERFIIAECYYQQVLAHENSDLLLKLKNEAEDNNPWALTRLAQLAIDGSYPYQDDVDALERGIKWLELLVEKDFAFAQLKLAEVYIKLGKAKKAKRLLKLCIEARIPDAAHLLSIIYKNRKPKMAEKFELLAKKWGYIVESGKQDDESDIDNEFNHLSLLSELSNLYVQEEDLFKKKMRELQNRKKKNKRSKMEVYRKNN